MAMTAAAKLRAEVCEANRVLGRSGLITLTWGNVSGMDRTLGLIAIKPSGVSYENLRPEDIVLLDIEGRVVDGHLNPSSDAATHIALYVAFPTVGGVAHTHSNHATMFAQACREIPCLGTTHADVFHGPIPLVRALTAEEVTGDYTACTGLAIAERFASLDPMAVPGALVAHHGPFAWGRNAAESVEHSLALEAIARMAAGTYALRPDVAEIPAYLLAKHYRRKHGPNATYGQQKGGKSQ